MLFGTPIHKRTAIELCNNRLKIPQGRRDVYIHFTKAILLFAEIPNTPTLLTENADKCQLVPSFSLDEIDINRKLSPEITSRISHLIQRFRGCFMSEADEVSLFRNGKHEPLKLKLSSRVYTQPRAFSIPTKLHSAFDNQLKTWLRQGVVAKQNKIVEYRTNIVPVKKKDGTYRFTLDCRYINAILQNENIPIPPVISLVRKAAGHRYYTNLDLASFFLIYKLDEESSDMLTFVAPSDGQLYKMKRTPFGLKSVMTNAIMLFEKELEVLTDRREWMVSYVDDLCVFHDDLDKHLFDLGRLLAVLTSINVKCKPSKTSIAQRECIWFGYKLD